MSLTVSAPGKYILLQRINDKTPGFYTQFRFGIDFTRNPKGELAFRVLGYADSESEAQDKLTRRI